MVAIKTLKSGDSEAQFIAETELQKTLHHPNLVQVGSQAGKCPTPILYYSNSMRLFLGCVSHLRPRG